MNPVCYECKFKILPKFKFCPRCSADLQITIEDDAGSEKSENSSSEKRVKKTTKKIVKPESESEPEPETDLRTQYNLQKKNVNKNYKTLTVVKKILSDKQKVHLQNLKEKTLERNRKLKEMENREKELSKNNLKPPKEVKEPKPVKKIEQKVAELELSESEAEPVVPKHHPVETIPEVPRQPSVNIYSSIFAPRTKY